MLTRNRLGSVVGGRWTIDSVLGQGGMSTVYAGTARDGRPVALKVLHAQHAGDALLRGRFLREARIAYLVDHPSCVRIETTATTDVGEPVLVMERVEGESLEAVWRRLGRRLPHAAALKLAEQLLSALEACHAAGVVHCDVKPANVIVRRGDALKLIDFGIACAPRLVSETAIDVTEGTPSFMPPEQVVGDPSQLDARVDVFAVGALLYTLLTGALLHRGATHDESLVLAATRPAPSLGAFEDGSFPDDLVALVDRALSPRPADRFPDAASMRAAVRAAIDGEQARATHEPRAAELRADDESGERVCASMSWVARRVAGELAVTPVAHVLRGIAARSLTGSLLLTDPRGRRHRLAVRDGGPIAHADELHRLGAIVAGTFEFFVDDQGAVSETTGVPRDPLEAILAVSRGAPAEVVRPTLARVERRALKLHPAARLDRFALRADEQRAIEVADAAALSLRELVESEVARCPTIEAVVFALGLTRHLPLGVPGAWPLGVPRAAAG